MFNLKDTVSKEFLVKEDDFCAYRTRTYNGDTLYLVVECTKPKITLERVFPNTVWGREEFDRTFELFNEKQKVVDHIIKGGK